MIFVIGFLKKQFFQANPVSELSPVISKSIQLFSPLISPTSTPISIPKQLVTAYHNDEAKFRISFGKPVYLYEHTQFEKPYILRTIYFSLNPITSLENFNGLLITFGIPYIDGKGGGCPDRGSKKEVVVGQSLETCDYESVFRFYLTHPQDRIEYDIAVLKRNDDSEEFEIFKKAIRTSFQLN